MGVCDDEYILALEEKIERLEGELARLRHDLQREIVSLFTEDEVSAGCIASRLRTLLGNP